MKWNGLPARGSLFAAVWRAGYVVRLCAVDVRARVRDNGGGLFAGLGPCWVSSERCWLSLVVVEQHIPSVIVVGMEEEMEAKKVWSLCYYYMFVHQALCDCSKRTIQMGEWVITACIWSR